MPLNVLIVDDSAVARGVIAKCLKMSGLPLGEIFQAANGAEGLKTLEANWIDLALVDINMPVMTGEEMIERLRAGEAGDAMRQLPVVVVSTEGSETRIERLEERGVTFVHKPFAPEIIRDVVFRVTGVTRED